MPEYSATAVASPNIAFIKYWGNRFSALRLPANGSISMNLGGLSTTTRVTFSAEYPTDSMLLNGEIAEGRSLARASQFLEHIRQMAGIHYHAEINTANNFPTGAGIASSASGFAALSLAAAAAIGLKLDERQLSRLARLGSGSACRSIPAGFVEWQPGSGDADSYAFSLFLPEHWALVDCIAVIATGHKSTGSTEGHASAGSSPLQPARVADSNRRLSLCRTALRQHDFDALATVVELDSNMMHAVMMTSNPALFYWEPASLAVMKHVGAWRQSGLPVFYTLDAGPNVHVITEAAYSESVCERLGQINGVQQVLVASVGGAAHLI